MSEQTFVQGDTAPDLTATIHVQGDAATPIDLSGATVKFQMRKADDRKYTINTAAVVIDAAQGQVSYSWGPNDLGVPGDYNVQWEITYGDGTIETTDPPNVITVRRQ